MATIREWLNAFGFNWESGKIIYQETCGDAPGWDEPVAARLVGHWDPILCLEFDAKWGGPECPRFVAEDDAAIYFPAQAQYDGSTWCVRIWKDLLRYLDIANESPYPGEG